MARANAKYSITAQDKASGTIRKLQGGFKDVDTVTRKLTGGMVSGFDNANRSMTSLTGAAGLLKGALLAVSGGAIVKTLSQTDKLTGALKTATGSIEGAQVAFKGLEKFATTTPFALDQSVRAFIQLKNLGLDPSIEALQSYGNTASAMGKDLSQFIEAVADASTNEFERLKEFGIKSKQQGDQVAFTFRGQTTIVRKSANEIESYLQKIGNTQFGSAMADQMELLPGAISNAEDAAKNLLRSIGDAGLTGELTKSFKFVGDQLNDLSEFVKTSNFAAELQASFAVFKEQTIYGFKLVFGAAKSLYDGVTKYSDLFVDYITNGAYSSTFDFIADAFLTLPLTAQIAWSNVSGVFKIGAESLKVYGAVISENVSYGFNLAALKIEEYWLKIKRGFGAVIDYMTDGLSKIFDDVQATNMVATLEDNLLDVKRAQLQLNVENSEAVSEMYAGYIASLDAIRDGTAALVEQREQILLNRDEQVASIQAQLEARANQPTSVNPFGSAGDAEIATGSPLGGTVTAMKDDIDLLEELYAKESAMRAGWVQNIINWNDAEKKSNYEKANSTLKFIQQETAGVARGSRAIFELNRVASISQGVLSMQESISTAYAAGMKATGTPWGAAAWAATAGLAQAANLAAIVSTSFGSGGGSAPSLSSSPGTPVTPTSGSSPNSSSTSEVSSQQPIIFIIGDMVDEEKVENLIATKLPDAYKNDKITFKNGVPRTVIRAA